MSVSIIVAGDVWRNFETKTEKSLDSTVQELVFWNIWLGRDFSSSRKMKIGYFEWLVVPVI